LKRTEYVPSWKKKFEKTRLLRGVVNSMAKGRTGNCALRSTHKSTKAAMEEIIKDAMTKGCFQGKMFPPRFRARIKNEAALINKKEPKRSNTLKILRQDMLLFFARLGPSSDGVVNMAQINMARIGGTWRPKVQRHPTLSQRKPPNAAPQLEPSPKNRLMYA